MIVLFRLLPDQCRELTQAYSLRKQRHDKLLTQRTLRLTDCNFICSCLHNRILLLTLSVYVRECVLSFH